MEVNCDGCAGCCIDWRAIADDPRDHERAGPQEPLDDDYNLVPLERDEVRAFVAAGLADALTPRLWRDEDGREVGGVRLATAGDYPVFFVGLRNPPKPVAPFDTAPRWLPTCVFLDPATLQCRIHGDDLYPRECAEYPGHNLALERETECERVEAEFGGDRLVDDDPPDDLEGLRLGPQALGAKVFVHPDPDAIAGAVERAAAGELTDEDRAEFVATAAAAAPGTLQRDEDRYRRAREAALAADSWAGAAIEEWRERAGEEGETVAEEVVAAASEIEDDRGAPSTPGWDDGG